MKMTTRYAHLSPAFLSAEVSLLDPPKPAVTAGKSLFTEVFTAISVPRLTRAT
jgi:hypothetical protein